LNDEIVNLLDRLVMPAYGWGPATTFFQLRQMAELVGRQGISLHGKTCVDFGCGAIRPLSTASLLYLLGADHVSAIDLAPPHDERSVAIGLYALLLAVMSGRVGIDTTTLGVPPSALRERCATFDWGALVKGDLRGVPPAIRLQTSDYLGLPAHERRFDFLTSYSALEHVADLPSYLGAFREAISDAGAIYIAIDYRDHRAYTIGASRWQFMIDDGDHTPGYINKLRHSELLQLITSAGFKVVQSRTVREEPSPQDLIDFLPRYQDMSRDDLTTTEAHLLMTPI
jgi:hypothetical protein